MCYLFAPLFLFLSFLLLSYLNKATFLRGSGLCGKCGSTLNLVDIAFLVSVAKNQTKALLALIDHINKKVRKEAMDWL